MSLIAVDLDDTLYSFAQLARREFAQMAMEQGNKHMQRGAYLAWVEWRSPADILGMDTWMEVIERCHTPNRIHQQTAFPDAADTVRDLVNQGHEILYISNRSPDVQLDTALWLDRQKFPIKGTELVCTFEDKMDYLTDCEYLIDDRPKTLVQFAYSEPRRTAFGIFGEHNRSLTDVPGIYLAPNWLLLRNYLKEKGVYRQLVG